jgi:hypothetical protein
LLLISVLNFKLLTSKGITMNPSRFALSNVSTVAILLASIALSGCSSSGTLRVAGPELPIEPPLIQDEPNSPVVLQSAIGLISTNTGAKVSSVGDVASMVGSFIAARDTEAVGIDNGVMTGLGGAIQQMGNAVDIFGAGTGNSLGKIAQEDANNTGQAEADIVALQMQSAPLVVEQVGGAVSSVGDAVAAIDNGQLNALSPVTNPAGALLNETGAGIASLSGNMTTAMDNAVVQQVTSGGSTMIHMIAIDVETTTQSLGATTGLGVPVNNLLVGTGLAVNNLGGNISSTFAASPLLSSTGGVVSAAGTLVASVGGLVTSPSTGNNSPSTFGNVIGSLSGAAAPGLAPSSPLTALSSQPALSTLLGGMPSTPALGTTPAPISGLIGGTGTGNMPSLGGALATVTAPLTGVLGSLR